MYNYNLVQALIASGKTVLNNGFIGGSAALNGDVECKFYRQSLFVGYTEWMRSVFSSGLDAADRAEVFSRVKDSAIAGIRKYRLIQSTAQEAVVVIDEVAVLKAKLAAAKTEIANLAQSNESLRINLRQAMRGVVTAEVKSSVGF